MQLSKLGVLLTLF